MVPLTRYNSEFVTQKAVLTPVPNSTRYARLVKFIRDTIVDSGCAKSNGRPNLKMFLERYGSQLKTGGGSMSYTTLRTLTASPTRRPYGETLTSLAILLSAARGEAVTVAQLNNLIDVPAIDAIPHEVDPDDLPDEEDGEIVIAADLCDRIESLPIDTRKTIAPRLLRLLAEDWAYLDAPPPVQMGQLLQADLARRGIGLERYAADVLNGAIKLADLDAIYHGRKPARDLSIEQILLLQQVIRSIDGDCLTYAELAYLAPNLDLPE